MSNNDGRIIDLYRGIELPRFREEWRGLRNCPIIPIKKEGWSDFVVTEWALEQAAWEDFHPHAEYNYVLEGELHIAVDGEEVVLQAGDSATVPAGKLGRYWAPKSARMLAIYGPNPDALESDAFKYEDL